MNGQIPVRHMPHVDGLIDRGFRDGAASNCVERAAGVISVKVRFCGELSCPICADRNLTQSFGKAAD